MKPQGSLVFNDMMSEESWFESHSDEEVYQTTGCSKGKLYWTPQVDHILSSWEIFSKKGHLDLQWKIPEKRPPSDDEEVDEESLRKNIIKEEKAVVAQREAAAAHNKAMADYDFGIEGDEEVATPTKPFGGQNRELKGSARKMKTSYNAVLSKMQRHRKMDSKP
ncbi:unnamed protein product [Lepeophtheirus salmonis]|uniref:(salmon louse) hypothetical protein n=1 Tax=Lepeophtheirus salmonis TaxID=72036 RepID=A0A7R8CZC9_LEPSM|nr:uncharacterized protein LOC121120376 isoform X2 [Lepeophtheirus salmonis]CAB4066665.1 unnamed protein product [Lepeophtheirus salmonis]CAF2975347.1 unnamed protein product [Lepeophtheirus salmonis]